MFRAGSMLWNLNRQSHACQQADVLCAACSIVLHPAWLRDADLAVGCRSTTTCPTSSLSWCKCNCRVKLSARLQNLHWTQQHLPMALPLRADVLLCWHRGESFGAIWLPRLGYGLKTPQRMQGDFRKECFRLEHAVEKRHAHFESIGRGSWHPCGYQATQALWPIRAALSGMFACKGGEYRGDQSLRG